ncbi:hypothetical protein F4802DRAFT_582670 [Xylaria palmicola]|nr:hypothetical protein F4802DRAFT_582670 [Xylaria palmicola]
MNTWYRIFTSNTFKFPCAYKHIYYSRPSRSDLHLTNPTMAPTVPAATYDLIGTWVGKQRQTPAPLTDRLQTAVLNLEYALKAESVDTSEPELGDTNWIGMLQEYHDRAPSRDSRDINYAENSLDPTGRGPLRWTCQVTMADAPGRVFAQAGPSFARKKDAKRYAAKCAIEWLQESGLIPKTGGVRWPKAPPPPPPQKQPKPQQQQQLPRVAPASPFDASEPSAAYQVSELCRDLRLPVPTYVVEPSGAGAEFFSAHAEYGAHGALLPFDPSLCRAEDVMGKKAAKEMVAELVHEQLVHEQQKRRAMDAAFLAQYQDGGA